MTLLPGTRFGSYEILAKLGEGGMGLVYRARDLRLDRDVALKLLPEPFLADRDRLARFEREAKLLAQLHHPNIASIFGLEESDGTRALVMELVDGPTLAERIAEGPMPLDEGLAIARQIAEALEEAHEKGIIHRDLKPANVKLTPDGKVKVLDFGLAKAFDPSASGISSSPSGVATMMDSPTLTAAGTQLGVILGTAAYMSPEQARGKPVDRRADIWAFGVLLHEMLTGRRLFSGETVSDTLAEVLKTDPDLAALPHGTPPAVERLLRRCLVRDPRHRLQSIGDARIELEGAQDPETVSGATAPAVAAPPPSRASRAWRSLPWAIAGAALVTLFATMLGLGRSEAPASATASSTLEAAMLPPRGTAFDLRPMSPGPAALSADGRFVAFSAQGEDRRSRLFVRELATGETKQLAGTEGAQYPFWSPDARWIAFFTQVDRTLKKVQATGGTPQTICSANNGKGGTWNGDDVILFAAGPGTPVSRVAAGGGEPQPVTHLGAAHVNSHRHPRFLPDGRHFLFLARAANPSESRVMVGSIDQDAERELFPGATQAEYASGHLLFVRESTLMAQPFDLDALSVRGAALPVAEGVIEQPNAAIGMFSASSTGLLAFHSGDTEVGQRLAHVDRSGAALSPLGEPAQYRGPEFAPDGRRLVVTKSGPSDPGGDLWIVDLARDSWTRFTIDPAEDINPVWSRDGSRIFFANNREGPHSVYGKSLAGRGEAERIYSGPTMTIPASASPDGRTLLILQAGKSDDFDPWILDLATRQASPLPVRLGSGTRARFSPDGRWIAYESDASGPFEIFLVPFPGPGRQIQASSGGGVNPYWRSDGREIVFEDREGRVWATPVETEEETIRVGSPKLLFQAPPPERNASELAASPDHDRFVYVVPGVLGADNELHLVVNWPARLAVR